LESSGDKNSSKHFEKGDFRRASSTLSRWIFGDLFFKDVFEKSRVVLCSHASEDYTFLSLFIYFFYLYRSSYMRWPINPLSRSSSPSGDAIRGSL
jgi:hypothetical protein